MMELGGSWTELKRGGKYGNDENIILTYEILKKLTKYKLKKRLCGHVKTQRSEEKSITGSLWHLLNK